MLSADRSGEYVTDFLPGTLGEKDKQVAQVICLQFLSNKIKIRKEGKF